MNAKDLNMLAYLDQLHDAGIDSIKIEGRNKKAFYVATVVSAYRRVLDGEPVSQVADELLSISHRPYSTGFYFGEGQQASQYDGYEQETMHVADVISCTLADRSIVADGQGLVDGSMDSDGQSYWLEVLCRNRFSEQDQLEVLEPFQPIHRVVVHDLNWLPDAEEGEQPLPLQPVPVANRTCNRYRFLIGRLVQPGSFLRIRQHRRSARHDGKAGGNQ